MILNILFVGLGGFLGSVLRYSLAGWVHRITDNSWFPYGTLAVNVLGCFLIGLLAELSQSRQLFNSEVRLFLFIGFLGGFTTFSTFAYETFSLAQDAQTSAAIVNAGSQLTLCLSAVWLGQVASRVIWR